MEPVQVSWNARISGVSPMPGGYDGYLDSLQWVAASVQEAPPSRADLATRIADHFDLTPKSADNRVGFLLRVGLIQVDSGAVILPEFMKSWLIDGDPTSLMVHLHQSLRFVGEMLEALGRPMSTADLLQLARERYLFEWTRPQQIMLRRGWLQSAGLVRVDNNRLRRTDAGTAFLDLVIVEPPLADGTTTPLDVPDPTEPIGRAHPQEGPLVGKPLPPDEQPSQRAGSVAELADRIVGASTDTRNPTEFETVVCEAFDFLGFDARHLGGSGDTDVLVDARLGLGASYRATIDAKTTSAPALQDQQVDWVTLGEHRSKHGADYSMLVGPNPSTRRLLERARSQRVAVLSADALAGLCRSHAAQPLGLAAYEGMFKEGGPADLARIEQQADEASGLAALARRLLDAIGEDAERFGHVTARDLHRGLARTEGNIVASEAQIQGLLDTLASPLVGAIQGDPDRGYVLACSPTVTTARLRILGEALADG